MRGNVLLIELMKQDDGSQRFAGVSRWVDVMRWRCLGVFEEFELLRL